MSTVKGKLYEGQVLEGKVACVLPGGEGVIRHQQQDIFLSHVIADDVVQCMVTGKRRGVWRGEMLQLLSPAKQRVAAPCPVATACGGCALQSMDTQAQASLKSSWVKQAFSASLNTESIFIPVEAMQEGFAGRRRVRWFVDQGKLGFRQRNSHQLVSTATCVALSSTLDALRNALQAQIDKLPPVIKSIQVIELNNGFHLILEAATAMPTPISPLELSLQLPIQWWWRHLDTPSIKPLHKPVLPLFDHIALQPYANTSIDIQIGANDFIQGQQHGNQQLISQMLAWSKGSKRVVDLFSGCGNLSLPIAAAFDANIIGAELNPNSVQAANKNAQRLQLDASYQTLDLFGKFNIEPFIAADTLMLDPPRKGAKHICNIMAQLFPKQVIMIHCDPAAGGRDALLMQKQGYKLQVLRALDLFPFTGHVETLSLWTPS